MIIVREASKDDACEISRIFKACYGEDYAYPQFYNLDLLTKMIYTDDTIILVAEDTETKELLGTASVICQIGAHSDLAGEFGRLAVDPAQRNRGIGKLLMDERLKRIEERLEVGIMDARLVHPYTLKIACKNGFNVIGFQPMKTIISDRESVSLLVRHFGQALELRNNNPRIIPEIFALASLALENCGVKNDLIVDESSSSYPSGGSFELSEMDTEVYPKLLRIQRGRVSSREVFGPLKLHYGIFKHKVTESKYLIARENDQIAGAIGFNFDSIEKAAKIFELIALSDEVIRFLLIEAEKYLQIIGAEFVEIDISAYSPRIQRTLIELGFVPAAYIPAWVFQGVERLDAVRMIKLNVPLHLGQIYLNEEAQEIADVVVKQIKKTDILPEIQEHLEVMSLIKGCDSEQAQRLAGLFNIVEFGEGKTIFEQDRTASEMYVVLSGIVEIFMSHQEKPLAQVTAGECLGEISFLTARNHSASARVKEKVKLAVITTEDLNCLVRQRPDIGVLLYRNLAYGLGEKLQRQDLVHH